jgi:hypothetical protein
MVRKSNGSQASLLLSAHVSPGHFALCDYQRGAIPRRCRRARSPRAGTVPQRRLDFVRANPEGDDDELSKLLNITPHQAINTAARKHDAQGLLPQFRRGRMVNRATPTE